MFNNEQIKFLQMQSMKMLRNRGFSYSQLVRLIRSTSGLGRKEFSARVGVDESTVKRIELKDGYNPTKASLEKILTPAGLGLGLVTIGPSRFVPKLDVPSPKDSVISEKRVKKTATKPRVRVVDGAFVAVS